MKMNMNVNMKENGSRANGALHFEFKGLKFSSNESCRFNDEDSKRPMKKDINIGSLSVDLEAGGNMAGAITCVAKAVKSFKQADGDIRVAIGEAGKNFASNSDVALGISMQDVVLCEVGKEANRFRTRNADGVWHTEVEGEKDVDNHMSIDNLSISGNFCEVVDAVGEIFGEFLKDDSNKQKCVESKPQDEVVKNWAPVDES